jgi:hypothetical protein
MLEIVYRVIMSFLALLVSKRRCTVKAGYGKVRVTWVWEPLEKRVLECRGRVGGDNTILSDL